MSTFAVGLTSVNSANSITKTPGIFSANHAKIAFICGLLILPFVVVYPTTRHWLLFPLWCCGILILHDAMDWLRGRLDLYDPVGILGLIGVHFFVVAPLLHLATGYWLPYVPLADAMDRPKWLGWMALINSLGLIVYRFARQPLKARRSLWPVWRINPKRVIWVLAIGMLLSALLQSYVYYWYGGFSGYIRAFSHSLQSFDGMGRLFLFSESFPVLAMLGFIFYARTRANWRSWSKLGVALLLFCALLLLFGGFRGSRSHFIWPLFWAVGCLHLMLRPIPRWPVGCGFVLMVAFMYAYGFYKSAGYNALNVLRDPQSRQVVETNQNRSVSTVLLGDFGRSAVQACVLYRLLAPDNHFDYSFGRSYLGALALVVPKQIWPERPATKVREGTQVMLGVREYVENERVSSHVYGLTGEWMLNFGPWFAPLGFAVLGLMVRTVRAFAASLDSSDARWVLVPILVNLCFWMLIADSDNVVVFLVKNLFIPLVVVVLSTDKGRPLAQ